MSIYPYTPLHPKTPTQIRSYMTLYACVAIIPCVYDITGPFNYIIFRVYGDILLCILLHGYFDLPPPPAV